MTCVATVSEIVRLDVSVAEKVTSNRFVASVTTRFMVSEPDTATVAKLDASVIVRLLVSLAVTPASIELVASVIVRLLVSEADTATVAKLDVSVITRLLEY